MTRPTVWHPDLKHALTELARMAGQHPNNRVLIERALALAGSLRHVAPIALEVAIETGGSMGRALAAVLRSSPDPTLAMQLLSRLPPRSIAAREVGVEAARQALAAVGAKRRNISPTETGRLTSTLSIWTHEVGDARSATQLSLRAVRCLVRAERTIPGAGADLALALNNLGVQLSELGKPRWARVATHAALAILEPLAKAEPDRFRTDLARTLMNLSIDHAVLGDVADAAGYGSQSVLLFRVAVESGGNFGKSELALALRHQSQHLARLGQTARAIDAAAESVAIYEVLVEVSLDTFGSELAAALDNYSVRLGEGGLDVAAIEADTRAIALWRRLVADRPSAFRHALARALKHLGADRLAIGQAEAAFEATREAVDHWLALLPTAPRRMASELAMTLVNLGVCHARLGRLREAYAVTLKAVRLLSRGSAGQEREDLVRLGLAWHNLSVRRTSLGLHEAALTASLEALAVRRRLASLEPETGLVPLGCSLADVGASLVDLGREEEAIATLAEAVEVLRSPQADPAAAQPDLALALANLAVLHHRASNFSYAVSLSLEALALYTAYAERTGRPAAQADVADQSQATSVYCAALGRWREARHYAQVAVTILRGLVQSFPQRYAHDLSRATRQLALCRIVGPKRSSQKLRRKPSRSCTVRPERGAS